VCYFTIVLLSGDCKSTVFYGCCDILHCRRILDAHGVRKHEFYHALDAVFMNCLGCVKAILRDHREQLSGLTLNNTWSLRDYAASGRKFEIDVFLKSQGLQYKFFARHPKSLPADYKDWVDKEVIC
jgi:hypothetical protein